MGMSARERAFINRVVNPVMTALITHRFGLPTYAVVQTTGRRSGRKRLVPVASGLDGLILRRLADGGDMLTIRIDLD